MQYIQVLIDQRLKLPQIPRYKIIQCCIIYFVQSSRISDRLSLYDLLAQSLVDGPMRLLAFFTAIPNRVAFRAFLKLSFRWPFLSALGAFLLKSTYHGISWFTRVCYYCVLMGWFVIDRLFIWLCFVSLLSRREYGGGWATSCSFFTWAGSHRSSGASVTLTRWLLPLYFLLHRWRIVVLWSWRDRLRADSRGMSFTIETCAASSPPSYPTTHHMVGSRAL